MAKKKKDDDPSGLIFVGCFLIGMGLGFYTGHLLPGIFIGLGVGFLGMFVAQMIIKKRK